MPKETKPQQLTTALGVAQMSLTEAQHQLQGLTAPDLYYVENDEDAAAIIWVKYLKVE
jgi:hypothetical protein